MTFYTFFLSGKKGHEVLDAAIKLGLKEFINLVVIDKDKHIQEDFSSEIIDSCKKYKIAYCDRNTFIKLSTSNENNIAIAAGWRWMIKASFKQILVFHDSLLPRYRGFNPLVTALLNKDEKIGVTAIIAKTDFDSGDIIGSKSMLVNYPIRVNDAINLISKLYFELASDILSKVNNGISLKATKQNESMVSYSIWRDENDYKINWSWTADEIFHFINCVSYPYNGASTICDGELIRILDAKVEMDVKIENRDVGKVLFIEDSEPIIICGRGLLRIKLALSSDGSNFLPLKKYRLRFK